MKYGTLRVPTLQLTKPTSTITLTSDWKEEDLNFSGNVFDPDSHDFDVILKNDRTGIEKVVAEYKDIPFSEKVEFNDTIDYNDLVTGSNSFTLFAVDNLGMSSQFKKINVNKGFSEVTVKFLNDMGEELADPITLWTSWN
ncbi:hypothetical protein [Enterococcus rivorum]|uniref:hypothetical protein n=1 Tax=Enterococcus rivorum TaxID=762845 RepID=UPI00362738F4